MATVRITYFGMEGEGKNVTEAKRDAGARIEAALTGDYHPEILEHRGWAVLLWRTPDCWHWRTIHQPAESIKAGIVWGSSSSGDRKRAIDSARMHLAQMGWQPADGTTAPDFIHDRHEIAEFASWCRFQLRYQEARARGMNDPDCFDYAHMNPWRPEVWQEQPAVATAVAAS